MGAAKQVCVSPAAGGLQGRCPCEGADPCLGRCPSWPDGQFTPRYLTRKEVS